MRTSRFLLTLAIALIPLTVAAQTTRSPLPEAGDQPALAPVPTADVVAGATLATADQAAATTEASAAAQTPQPAASQAASTLTDQTKSDYVSPPKNILDFGVRGTSISGDKGRYEPYRDMGNGLFLEKLRLSKETSNNWFMDLAGDHVGRKDQRLRASFVRPGTFNAEVQWDQIPLLSSDTTRVLYTSPSPDVLTINDAIQAQVQANTSALGALVQANAMPIDVKQRWYTGSGKAEYIATPELTLNVSFNRTNRNGTELFGGSFGHGNLIETVAPVKDQLTNSSGGAEFAQGPVLVRAGYTASLYHNDYSSLTFDNPFRAVDIASASSRGRTSLAPSDSMFTVNGLASFKMPARSRVTAYISEGTLKDAAGTPILPQTVNTATTGLAPLERTTVDGQARTSAANLTFTSRPSRDVDIDVRYRYYNYDNRTPLFSTFQRVQYDNSISTSTTASETKPYSITRKDFDADVQYSPVEAVAIGVGFSNLGNDRTYRAYGATSENVARVTLDSVGNKWFSLRTKFEHSARTATLDQEAYDEMVADGEQPGMIQFDIAPRNRNEVTVIGSAMPGANMSISVSMAAGKDDYTKSLFGLRNDQHRLYSAEFDSSPAENVTLSAAYSYRAVPGALALAPGQPGRPVHRRVAQLGRQQQRPRALDLGDGRLLEDCREDGREVQLRPQPRAVALRVPAGAGGRRDASRRIHDARHDAAAAEPAAADAQPVEPRDGRRHLRAHRPYRDRHVVPGTSRYLGERLWVRPGGQQPAGDRQRPPGRLHLRALHRQHGLGTVNGEVVDKGFWGSGVLGFPGSGSRVLRSRF